MGKILSITEKLSTPAVLPDGVYSGTWGGNVIDINYKGKTYELTTQEGVRGFGYKVVVHVQDGVGTYEELKN